MATVTLANLWLNSAANPSDGRAFLLRALSEMPEVTGDVRRYANGRLRLITRAGESMSLQVTVRTFDGDGLDDLRARAGTRQCLRDQYGRKLYGVFLKPTLAEVGGPNRPVDVSFTFVEVTVSEAV